MKRAERWNGMSRRLRQLDDTFLAERDVHYADMLHKLQISLYALHMGSNPEFLEKVADLEEARDLLLTELYLWEQYQREEVDSQYNQGVEAANSEQAHMLKLFKEKLRLRLETQRKRLAEDRSVLDISGDHAFLMNCVTSTESSRNAHLSGTDRRSLRRTAMVEDFSGVSGSEARSRRTRNAQSDAETGSDRDLDSMFKDYEAPAARHITKSYQGVKVLKPEDCLTDLALIRDNSKRMRKSR